MRMFWYIVIQLVIVVGLSPLVNGIIMKIKALTQKRKGAPVFQQYLDLYKLLKKQVVVSETASWIFTATPYIVLASALLAAMLVPVSMNIKSLVFPGDILLLIYVFALGRFFMTLSGLDTASTFSGMGSSREIFISCMMEPTFLVCGLTVALVSGSTSIATIIEKSAKNGGIFSQNSYITMFLAMIVIIIAETARIPVDDPSTHLELTMIHEAMLLEYSGRYLAFMELASAIKQMVLLTLLVNVFLPIQWQTGNFYLSILVSLLIFAIKIVLSSVLIAIAEVTTVKLKLFSIPNLSAVAFILSFLGFIQYYLF